MMTKEQLAKIESRVREAVSENDYIEPVYGSATYVLIMRDIPALLEHIRGRDR
jgi:hypothetical protein